MWGEREIENGDTYVWGGDWKLMYKEVQRLRVTKIGGDGEMLGREKGREGVKG